MILWKADRAVKPLLSDLDGRAVTGVCQADQEIRLILYRNFAEIDGENCGALPASSVSSVAARPLAVLAAASGTSDAHRGSPHADPEEGFEIVGTVRGDAVVAPAAVASIAGTALGLGHALPDSCLTIAARHSAAVPADPAAADPIGR